MSLGLYAAGYAIVIIGLAYAARLARISPHWIFVGAIVMIGMGILSTVKATRQKMPVKAAPARHFKFLFPGVTIAS